MTRNHEPYRNSPGEYSTNLVASTALGFLDDAIAASDRPFFIGVAPIAPHSETITNLPPARFEPPVPAKRHEHLLRT
jgi:N-acetylglucosamine-6-sulfatase